MQLFRCVYMQKSSSSHGCQHILHVCVMLFFTFTVFLFGCTGTPQTSDSKTMSRHIARASQAMSLSAKLGSMAAVDAQYKERAPNPNSYVGKQVYRRYCESCHGHRNKAPDILKNRVTASDPESDYYIILYGVKEMPAFRSRLTKFQILDILKYMNPEFTGLEKRTSATEEK